MNLETYNKILNTKFVIAHYRETTLNWYEFVMEIIRTDEQAVLYSIIVDKNNRPTKKPLSYNLLNYMSKD